MTRLQELVKQATHDVLGVKQLDSIILAELIVKECVETLGTYEENWPHKLQMDMLKDHFGIEQ